MNWDCWNDPDKYGNTTREGKPMITNLQELRDYFGADTVSGLNRRLYKDTACGASISLLLGPDPQHEGFWLHNGFNPELWASLDKNEAYAYGFSIQTIVEGSDATVDSDPFLFPVEEATVAAWMEYMEAEARLLWKEANEDDRE